MFLFLCVITNKLCLLCCSGFARLLPTEAIAMELELERMLSDSRDNDCIIQFEKPCMVKTNRANHTIKHEPLTDYDNQLANCSTCCY